MADQNVLRRAFNILPGGAALQGAQTGVNNAQARQNRRPNSRQHAQNLQSQQAARNAALRRQRIESALQDERRRMGQVPLSRRELDTALSEYQ